ncbi:hypothetical protein JYU34_005412 [Plutella xylostella]|uniref:Uncharacterized protein n=1 Tax=Plutella xylostella TaxID=51655 RepID=A0ABQ7QWM1_PLUXY|nr:hypothetical protein JYU34_005412 [Plutella xylostella]
MGDSLFDIFGDHITRQTVKNVSRQPLSNVENMGKTSSSGPYKPNEPAKPSQKKGEVKKSFLSNTGKAFQSTPLRQAFTARAVNVGSMIYSDAGEQETQDINLEELEFTKPSYKLDNYHTDIFDYWAASLPPQLESPAPRTPSPAGRRHSLEFNCSYQDEFFTDEFSNDAFPDSEDDLPPLY